MKHKAITHVAVVGTGLIGAAWTSLFLAKNLSVLAIDPAIGHGDALMTEMRRVWLDLQRLGLASGPIDGSRLSICDRYDDRLGDVQFVQECVPENLALKRKVFADIEQFIPDDTPIASSTSALLVADIQSACRSPGRCLSGHPFNPPHLLPLVEISGGPDTDPAILDIAAEFYRSVGKEPVVLKREIPGHIAGRLSAALLREAASLLQQGVADVAEIDAAMRYGPGLRLATGGPFLAYHLGGGEGGIRAYLEHLGDSQQARWDTLGTPRLNPDLRQAIIDGVNAETKAKSVDDLTNERDALLTALLLATNATSQPDER